MSEESRQYDGMLEIAGANGIAGWAVNAENPGEPVEVEILVNGEVLRSVTASLPRPDLARPGAPPPACGFEIPVPFRIKGTSRHLISTRIRKAGFELRLSPRYAQFPFDLSQPLEPERVLRARRVTVERMKTLPWMPDGLQAPPMNIHLVCYEELNEWILGKITKKLREHLEQLGHRVSVGDRADPVAQINHHIIYWGYVDRKRTPESVMITHIENHRELMKVRQQLMDLRVEMGVCMSLETVMRLREFGIPAEKLCFISPAHDRDIRPRKINIGITTRLYEDGCKREHVLTSILPQLDSSTFRFTIMGSGWERIVAQMRSLGIEVAYHDEFNPESYRNLVPAFDWFLYMGMDEGSLGYLDALAAAIPTIVTPQGFHLDIPNGITHAIETADDLKAVLDGIATEKSARSSLAVDWTWRTYAEKHALLWWAMLLRTNGEPLNGELEQALASMGWKSYAKEPGA